MSHVASLGMYDHPAVRPANDRLWSEIADTLRDVGVGQVPAALDRARPLAEIWRDPALLLAQCCGYPLLRHHADHLRIVGVPVYLLAGQPSADHFSLIVVREADDARSLAALEGRRAALNDPSSNSGMNLFRAAVAEHASGPRFFGAVLETGGHRESALAVVECRADVAAIDAISFAHLERAEPGITARLRVLQRTASSPNLPFVTSRHTPLETVGALRLALADVVHRSVAAESLFLTGVERADLAHYQPVRDLEEQAIRRGYPELR